MGKWVVIFGEVLNDEINGVIIYDEGFSSDLDKYPATYDMRLDLRCRTIKTLTAEAVKQMDEYTGCQYKTIYVSFPADERIKGGL